MNGIEWLGTIQSLPLKLGIASLWLVGVGALAGLVDRWTPPGSEYVRKVVHIGTGNIILLAWWMHIPPHAILLAGIFFGIVTLLTYQVRSDGRQWLASINQVGRQSYGTFFYAVSIGILGAGFGWIQRPEFAVVGILVMTWGDGLAGLIGKQFGRYQYEIWGMKKSWEGSIVMLIVSTLVTYVVLASCGLPSSIASSGTLLAIAIVVGGVAASLEAFSKYGLDNLTVPLVSSVIAYHLVNLASEGIL